MSVEEKEKLDKEEEKQEVEDNKKKDEESKAENKENKQPEAKEEKIEESKADENIDKEPEKKEDSAELKSEVIRLKEELTKAQNENASVEQLNNDLSIQKNLVSEYEEVINTIIEAKLQNIPDNIKELIPNALNLKDKLEWLAKAEKSGIFNQGNPDIEIGKPLSAKDGKQPTDTSKLNASTLMAMAYGNSKK